MATIKQIKTFMFKKVSKPFFKMIIIRNSSSNIFIDSLIIILELRYVIIEDGNQLIDICHLKFKS